MLERVWGKGNPSTLLVGMYISVATLENSTEVPQKTKNIVYMIQQAQTVKNLPAMQETWVESLGWEDPLEEVLATHSSVLAWRIPIDRGAWQAIVHGVAKCQT